MKKSGILNAPLSQIVARMGHTDKLVICDSGLPIPKGVDLVDLAVTQNIPRFLEVLKITLQELEVEKAIIAEELEKSNNGLMSEVKKLLPDTKFESVPHEKFKELTRSNGDVSFVRTGETTPYANIILVSGVTF